MFIHRQVAAGLILSAIFSVSLAGSMQTDSVNTSIGDRGPAIQSVLTLPSAVAVDKKGNIFIAERGGNRIRRIDAQTDIITTIAGTGRRSYSGDGGPAAQAEISIPECLAFDARGNLYFTDRGNSRIRRVDAATGIITTVAGTGVRGYSGDGGPAARAEISSPYGIALDRDGHIFFADTENQCYRRIDARTGIITTVAGNGQRGFSGDGGPATEASFSRPHVLTIDSSGNLILGDSFNQRIRKVERATGIITTIAGTGEQGFSGDGGPATKASFKYFGGLVLDSKGNLFITDGVNNRIRKIAARTGIITTVAGTGEKSFGGDGGPALQAQISWPYGIALDGEENIIFADWENNRVRRIDARTGIITTVAGAGNSSSGSRQ